MRGRRNKYSGELRTKITRRKILDRAAELYPRKQNFDVAELAEAVHSIQVEKLFLLANLLMESKGRWRVPASKEAQKWFVATLLLARIHVPGMQIFLPHKMRRATKSPERLNDESKLLADMATAMLRLNTVAAAAAHLSKQKAYRGRKPDAIRKQYDRLLNGPFRGFDMYGISNSKILDNQ